MPNHVHLIAVPGSEEGLRRGIAEAHRREPVDEQMVRRLRRHEATGRPLGSARFVTRLEGFLGRILHPQKLGRKRKPQK